MKRITGPLIVSISAFILFISAVCAGTAYEIEVIDSWTYAEKSDYWSLDMAVPLVIGMADAAEQWELNAYFQTRAEELMTEYLQTAMQAAESIASGNSPDFAYRFSYDVVTDSDDFFVIRTTSFFRSSSVTETSEYRILDKRNGREAELDDIVKTPAEMAVIREQIYQEMLKFNNDAGAPVYRTGDNALPEALEKTGEKHHWYINENRELVITFDKYELGPAILGSPEFVISSSVFSCTH